MIRLLDTHCHVDAYDDPRAVLHDAGIAEVDVVAVTETPEGYRRLRTRLGRAPGVVVALGLHPGSRAAAAPGQLERFFRMLPTADWVGEVGLDFRPGADRTEKSRQTRVFEAILAGEQARSKPMTVHSRGAARETVKVLASAPCRAVLHWYTGPANSVDDALAAGLRFSVNTAMIRSTNGRALVRNLPVDRVLCETDGPYCRHGTRPAVPSDLRTLVTALADAWGADESDALAQLLSNAAALTAENSTDT